MSTKYPYPHYKVVFSRHLPHWLHQPFIRLYHYFWLFLKMALKQKALQGLFLDSEHFFVAAFFIYTIPSLVLGFIISCLKITSNIKGHLISAFIGGTIALFLGFFMALSFGKWKGIYANDGLSFIPISGISLANDLLTYFLSCCNL